MIHESENENIGYASNMPIEICHMIGEKEKVTFEKTPEISTYVFGFMIGEFDFCQAKTESGIAVRKLGKALTH